MWKFVTSWKLGIALAVKRPGCRRIMIMIQNNAPCSVICRNQQRSRVVGLKANGFLHSTQAGPRTSTTTCDFPSFPSSSSSSPLFVPYHRSLGMATIFKPSQYVPCYLVLPPTSRLLDFRRNEVPLKRLQNLKTSSDWQLRNGRILSGSGTIIGALHLDGRRLLLYMNRRAYTTTNMSGSQDFF